MTDNKANGSSQPTRDELRTQLLSGFKNKVKSERLTIFGVEIELRQPTLGSILEAQADNDPRTSSVNLLIRFACVPGTSELIFEAGDADTLLQWPFGEDLVKLQEAISRLTGLDITEAKEEIHANPTEGVSSTSAEH
jgi:hypothetical protein